MFMPGLSYLGYTGDADKSSWIKTELGFDWAFNYKTQDVSQTLKIASPGENYLQLYFSHLCRENDMKKRY